MRKITIQLRMLATAMALAAISISFMTSCGSDEEEPTCNLKIASTVEETTITVSVTSGATQPVGYSINGTDFTSNNVFTGLAAGTYTVTVKDANNCQATEKVTVVDACQSQPITLSVKAEAYAIVAKAEGGNGTLEYFLDEINFQVTDTIKVAEAKAYTLTVKDEKGCTATANISAEAITSFTDTRDNQTYKVVKIGDQIWMAENFNYAVADASWCYNDEAVNCAEFGKLYTWDAAMNNAPDGWKLPSDDDWSVLVNQFGDEYTAGDDLRVGGNSGFNAKMGGLTGGGKYYYLNENGVFWSSTEDPENPGSYYVRVLYSSNDYAIRHYLTPDFGLGVRYLKK